MTDAAITAAADTEQAFARFQSAYLAQRFDEAASIFMDALTADPGGAFRCFAQSGAGQLSEALDASKTTDAVAARLDALIADHPNLHLVCPNEPAVISECIATREESIRKGLPSAVLISMGKSASIAVGNIFSSGYRMPSFAYCLTHLRVIDSWARDYARGGACYVTHLDPSRDAVQRLKAAGLNKIIVHVRDPRQALVSLVHHFDRYPDQLVQYRSTTDGGHAVSQRAMNVLPLYAVSIDWIKGWLDLEPEIDVLFSTFEDFVKDRKAFVDRYLEFHGGDRAYFDWNDAFGEHTGIDDHFRSGRTDEWREVFSREDAEYLTSLLPLRIKERFGWSDPGDLPSRYRGSVAGSETMSPRDQFLVWLHDGDAQGDAAAVEAVQRLRAAGEPDTPPELEERAIRGILRDFPDRGVLLRRLWELIERRGGQVPAGLIMHALRSRLAELSGPNPEQIAPDIVERERAAIIQELTVREIAEAARNGRDVRSLVADRIDLDAPTYDRLGRELAKAGALDGAEAAFRRAVAVDPARTECRLALADVLDRLGRRPEAVLITREVAGSTRSDAQMQARLGSLLVKMRDFDGAEAALRRAIEVDPAALEFRHTLGDVLEAKGEPAAAAEIFQALIAAGSRDVQLHARLGRMLIRQADFDGAEAAFRGALAIEPALPDLRRALGDVLEAKGQPAAAVKIFQQLVAEGLRDLDLHARLGRLLIRAGDFDGAEVVFRRAIEIEFAASDFPRALADVLDAKGQSGEAAEIVQRLVAQRPDDAQLTSRLGRLLIRQGDLRAAEAILRRALELDPTASAPRCDLADVLDAQKRSDDALALLRPLVTEGSRDAQLHARFGRLLLRRGELDDAEAAFRTAIAIDPETLWFHSSLNAIAEQRRGRGPAGH
jgi:tetratricopeptide (TPR) repeat protein